MDKDTWEVAIQVAAWTVNILAILVFLDWITPNSVLACAAFIFP